MPQETPYATLTGVLTAHDLIDVTPFVDGRFVPSDSDGTFAAYDPNSGRVLAENPDGSAADVDRAVASARRNHAEGAWRGAAPTAKKSALYRWADLIERNADRLDALDALEMGKPVSVSAFNASAAAALVRFNAEALDKQGGDILTSDRTSMVLRKRVPRGVVAAIVPWNFPTYNAALKIAPALAAGNSVILKPSELASQAALILAALALDAGLPPGTLNVVPGRGNIVGKALAEHMSVDMVTFTGSSVVGKRILEYAGRSNMKVVSAECGGKSPHIVFHDEIDLNMVAHHIAGALLLNQGQVCSLGSRLLVEHTIEDLLVAKILKRLELAVAGDPQLRTTTYGPIVSKAQLEKLLGYVASGKAEGADLVHGGAPMPERSGGYFFSPTVFTNVPPKSRISQEEIFGPVLSVLRFHDIDEAIELANGTCFGLAAYIWTSRTITSARLASELNSAYTIVNAAAPAGEGPGMGFSCEPFGLSGTGIEGGMAGLDSYSRKQTLWFNHG